MLTPPRPIASNASRLLLWATLGGAGTVGLALAARVVTRPADADGTSPGRIDRSEARRLFSGPYAPTTIVPLLAALVCIGTLYTKGRVLMPDGAVPAGALSDALRGVGVAMEAGEGMVTKSLYVFLGGSILGSMAADGIVYGDLPQSPVPAHPSTGSRLVATG